MEQRITVKIAEREFVLRATSPEDEELIRIAAAGLNRKIAANLAKFPGKSLTDILSFVALTEAVAGISRARALEKAEKETSTLVGDLDRYLDKTK